MKHERLAAVVEAYAGALEAGCDPLDVVWEASCALGRRLVMVYADTAVVVFSASGTQYGMVMADHRFCKCGMTAVGHAVQLGSDDLPATVAELTTGDPAIVAHRSSLALN